MRRITQLEYLLVFFAVLYWVDRIFRFVYHPFFLWRHSVPFDNTGILYWYIYIILWDKGGLCFLSQRQRALIIEAVWQHGRVPIGYCHGLVFVVRFVDDNGLRLGEAHYDVSRNKIMNEKQIMFQLWCVEGRGEYGVRWSMWTIQ